MHDLEALVDLARDDYDAGRYGDAEQTLDVLITHGGPCLGRAALLRARLAIRCGHVIDAVRIIGEARPFFDEAELVEADLHLMLAHAFAGDTLSAEMYANALVDVDVFIPSELRAEIVHARASAAWSRGDVAAAEDELRRCQEHADHGSRARHLQLLAAIAGRREDYGEQANLLCAGLDAIAADDRHEVPLAAALLRSLCIVVRELPVSSDLADRAISLYREMPWTSELGSDRFLCALQLGWARSLAGDSLGALRFAHDAYTFAPSTAWQVMALADRAALKRGAGEMASSLIDLEDGLALAESIDWAETLDEERLALVTLAELAAAADGPRAQALLLRSETLRPSGSKRLHYHSNRRLRAIAQHAAGVVAHAVGDNRLATMSLRAAYEAFEQLGCTARACQTALVLHAVTGDEKWLRSAVERARAFPRSWLAAAARRASSGISDESFARLTPKQREVFRALLDGLTASRIAERVGSRPNTVRNHIHNVYTAFGVTSQAELLAEARRRRLA